MDIKAFLRSIALSNGLSEEQPDILAQSAREKMLGTSPETLSRALKKMSTQGIIEVKGRTITTLDKEALEDLAQG
ncbi:MAG: winged helix-turn-helix domain-containing protein [Deltaproteobacteria bacterium]|nr:winged helix-turn-helix domain-containing protein [Deltaproteobacteria bacterium]